MTRLRSELFLGMLGRLIPTLLTKSEWSEQIEKQVRKWAETKQYDIYQCQET